MNRRLFLVAKSKPKVFQTDSTQRKVMESIVFPILERFDVPEIEKKYVSAFFVTGVQAIVMEWVKDECNDDINYISELIIRFVVKRNEKL